jgi:hypothetical protein
MTGNIDSKDHLHDATKMVGFDLEKAKKTCENVTPGPWMVEEVCAGEFIVISNPTHPIWEAAYIPDQTADSVFISASRMLLPAAISYIEQQQKRIEELEALSKLVTDFYIKSTISRHSNFQAMCNLALSLVDNIETLEEKIKELTCVDELKAVIRNIEHELIKSNHAYLDLQQICDDQAKRIAELEAKIEKLTNALIISRMALTDAQKTDATPNESMSDKEAKAKEQLQAEGLI